MSCAAWASGSWPFSCTMTGAIGGLLFVGILLFAWLCQSSYTNKKAHVTCPSCGYEFEVRECEKCE